MPSLKVSAKTSTTLKSERLVLSEHIAKCSNIMDKFLEATQQFQEYKTDVFADLDRQIEAKKQELIDVTQTITSEEEETRISTKQKLQEFKRNAAIEVLNETDEVPIASDELEKMREELDKLRENKEDLIAMEVGKVRDEETKTRQTQINSIKLQHAADIATLKATSEQKVKEVEVLRTTIEDLKHELAEQRELTKSVASSLKQGAITLNTGKQ
jgi:hypothetical protein